MRRRWTIVLGVVLTLLVLLVINALVVDGETEGAHVTVPGGRILDLPDGDLQVLERGPRGGSPIVLIHCFTCAIDWWDRMLPMVERRHRVIAVDLLGHGGSEKPGSGYTPQNQALVVSEALERLHVGNAEVVGHSLGGTVAVALAQEDPSLVGRVVIIDMPPDNSYGSLGFLANLAFRPVIGEALWTIKPDFAVRDGLEVAFAPGFDVPDAFVDDVKRLTYTAYDNTPAGENHYLAEESLDQRLKKIGKPLMVLMGTEEQIVDDPRRALAQYKRAVPSAQTHLIPGAGHSPNVEKPRETAQLVLHFARRREKQVGSSVRDVTERGSKPPHEAPPTVP
ncbi:MAG TPA: alpha/beta fold hydrolase [Solirubrobacterales bacterium]